MSMVVLMFNPRVVTSSSVRPMRSSSSITWALMWPFAPVASTYGE